MATRTRRSNGEGSTPRKRTDGRWQINIQTSQTTDGKIHRKTLYGRTRAEVVAKARTYRKHLENGLLADTGNQTLHNWTETWLNQIAAQRVRPQTLSSYRGYIERWVNTTPIAQKQLEQIKPKDIELICTGFSSDNYKTTKAPSTTSCGVRGPDPWKVDTSGVSYAAWVSVADVSASKSSGARRLHQECRLRVL